MRSKNRDGIYERKNRTGFYFRDPLTGKTKKAQSLYLSGAKQELAREKQKAEKRLIAQEMFGVIPPEPGSFPELCQRFLAYQKTRLTPAAYERERFIIQSHFLRFFPSNPAEIQPATVERYMAFRAAQPARPGRKPKHREPSIKPGAKLVSGSTIAKEVNSGRHLFRWAIKNRLAISNPFQDVDAPRQNRPRVRWLTPVQVRAILENSPHWLQPIIGLAVATGMRRSEILGLHWSEISLENGIALLPKTKNGDGRIVPLNQFAQTVIRSLPPNPNPNDLLFPDVDPMNVSVCFPRVCRRAGIEGFTFHDLRHTFASYLRQQGQGLDVIARVIGHRTLSMASRYAHLANQQILSAASAIDAMLTTQ